MRPCRSVIGLLVILFALPSWAESPGSSLPQAPPPRVLSWVAPYYSPAAQEAQLTPTVEVLVQIDENGEVLGASSTHWFPLGLAKACEDAARQWRFAPGAAPFRTVHLVFSFLLDRSGSRLPQPPEAVGPYHVRVWGQLWGEPASQGPLPCTAEGLDYTLTRPEPQVLSWVAAQYTEVARKARLQGTVIVVAEVDSKGRVAWTCARKELPMGLDKGSEVVLRKWRFAPDPRPVRWVEVELDFTVNEAEETERPAELISPYHLRIWSNTQTIESEPVY